MRRPLITAALWVGLCLPASANWQWTVWGESRATLEAAAKINHVTLTEAPNSHPSQVELNAPYATLNMEFTARFIFNQNDQLFEVVLMQIDYQQCLPLSLFLKASYGAPYDSHDDMVESDWSWRDPVRGNNVQFLMINAKSANNWCDIQYSRLSDAKNLGL